MSVLCTTTRYQISTRSPPQVLAWSSHRAYSNSKDQPGKAANPGRGQPNRENEYFLSPTARVNLVLRDGFGNDPVPRQPAHLHTHAESDAYLGDSSRFPRRRPFIYLNRHTPSCRYRVFYALFSSKFVSG